MKKHTYVFLALFLFMVFPMYTFAVCTNEEIAEFNKVSDGYKMTYTFNSTTKNYDVVFYKPREEFSVLIASSKFTNCSSLHDGKFECYDIPSGEYKIKIIGNTTTCDDTLKTIKLILPEFNKYSEDELCKGIEEFVLCQPTYDKEVDYETFVSRVNTYKNNKNTNTSDEPKVEKEDSKVAEYVEYLEDNMFEIIIVAIFMVLVVVTAIITIRSIKKSRRLE